MPSLLTKTRHVAGVISLRDLQAGCEKDIMEGLKTCFSESASVYGMILHDKDINDDGTLKTPHIHFVAEMKASKRLSTWLNAISTASMVSPLAVSVERFTSFEGVYQYLIHKNDSEKFQYPVDSIVTNLDDAEKERYLTATASGIDFKAWLAIIERSDDLLEVIEQIGITYYQKYRATIQDMYDFVRKNKMGISKLGASVDCDDVHEGCYVETREGYPQ